MSGSCNRTPEPTPAAPAGENRTLTFKVLLALARLVVSEIRHKKIWLAALGLTAAYLALFGAGMRFLTQAGGNLDRLGLAQLFNMALFLAAPLAASSSQGAGAIINLGIVSSLILPADVLYRRASYLLLARSGDLWHGLGSMEPFGVASVPSRWMVLYAGVYLVVCLFMAMRVFARKDIG